MTRLTKFVLSTICALSMIAGQAHADLAPPISAKGSLHSACRNQFKDGQKGWSISEAKNTIRCWARRFGASEAIALCISRYESGWQHMASNGTHFGLFQWSGRYWPSTRNQFPVLKRNTAPSVFNARTNAAYALKWQSRIGYSPWAGNRCV
jgi:hypothetical protein